MARVVLITIVYMCACDNVMSAAFRAPPVEGSEAKLVQKTHCSGQSGACALCRHSGRQHSVWKRRSHHERGLKRAGEEAWEGIK